MTMDWNSGFQAELPWELLGFFTKLLGAAYRDPGSPSRSIPHVDGNNATFISFYVGLLSMLHLEEIFF